jgi:hypothetical protein
VTRIAALATALLLLLASAAQAGPAPGAPGERHTWTAADKHGFGTAMQPESHSVNQIWPLLTGEHGEYELLAGRDATSYLETIASTANDGLMLPEQVWDGRPPTGRPGHEFGEGTRSATPLGWTHAQLIRLAWSIEAGTPIERPSIVAERYASR